LCRRDALQSGVALCALPIVRLDRCEDAKMVRIVYAHEYITRLTQLTGIQRSLNV
jgi:hypothetical protein